MKIKTQLFLGNSIVLAFMAIIAVVMYLSINSLTKTASWVNHTQTAISNGNALVSYMVDQETGMRGYLATGEEEYLEPYTSGKANFTKILEESLILVSDNPNQINRLKRINKLASDWEKYAAGEFIEIKRHITEAGVTNKALDELVNSDKGKIQMDEIRSALNNLTISNPSSTILVNSLILDMINQETGVRGFILTHNEETLDPYITGKEAIKRHLAELSNHGVNIADVSHRITKWDNEIAAPKITLQKTINDMFDRQDELASLLNSGVGKLYMDDLRSVVIEFIGAEQTLMEVRIAEAQSTANFATNLTIFGTLFAFIVGFLIIVYITRRLIHQLGGEPAEVNALAKDVANGNLSTSIDLDKTYKGLKGNIIDVIVKLRSIVDLINRSSALIKETSVDINQKSLEMADGTHQQASAAEESSASMEQITAAITLSQNNVDQTSEIIQQADQDVLVSQNKIIENVDNIKSINEQIKIISDIAYQTNLLSLNAAVEAAKSGDIGNGFAVVATEIKKLAERSRDSSITITKIADSTLKSVLKSKDKINSIVPDIQKTSTLMLDISTSTQEQVLGATQINLAIQNLNEVIQKNQTIANEVAEGSVKLDKHADSLKETMSFFQVNTPINLN
jgi:methyl-accepting chemotaxis protein